MKALPALFARGLRQALRGSPIAIARLLLAAWAVGLVVTFFQLDDWRREISGTLLQLNADAQFRARAPSRDAVDPAWYRRKALALLAAAERLEHDTTWTLFVPGSWRIVDDLEEQVQRRIQREFGDIVVETIARELYARASRLTGVPQLRGATGLQAGAECIAPPPRSSERRLSAAPEDLPEFVALQGYVAEAEQLDEAVQAFLQLQRTGGDPEQLRKLVAYALDAQVPGGLARSVQLFHGLREVDDQPALMQSHVQAATRCSLDKAVGALYARLLNTNDLFALEQGLADRSAGLFDAPARQAAFSETLERYRAVHALLEDQHHLLARGRNGWMRDASSASLGPEYDRLLQRIERVGLWGSDVQRQVDDRSGLAFAEFRRQFQARFGNHAAPGIVWLEQENRFGLSPERAALREGLAALLQAPFMNEGPVAAHPARTATSLAEVVQHARKLAAARDGFLAETLPRFPATAQPAVQRVVDARVSELIYEQAFRTLKASLPQDAATPLDAPQFRAQRDQVAQLRELLRQAGGDAWANRLTATLDDEVTRRLARLAQDGERQPLLEGGAIDFADWDGEQPLAVAARIGAEDASLGRLAARLEALGDQAQALVALGAPAGSNDAQQLNALHAAAVRYQQRQDDSSLLRLERYLQALGSDLKRDNCMQRLAAAPAPRGAEDAIARRHLALHEALSARCRELRAQVVVAPTPVPAPAPAPAPDPAPMVLPATLPPPVLAP